MKHKERLIQTIYESNIPLRNTWQDYLWTLTNFFEIKSVEFDEPVIKQLINFYIDKNTYEIQFKEGDNQLIFLAKIEPDDQKYNEFLMNTFKVKWNNKDIMAKYQKILKELENEPVESDDPYNRYGINRKDF